MDQNLQISDSIKESIVGYLSGKLSPEQAQLLLNWLEENESHKKFFDHITDIWHSSSLLTDTRTFDANKAWNEVMQVLSSSPETKNRNLSVYYKIAAAAAIILLIGLGFFFTQKKSVIPSLTEQYTEMEAPRGSKITLNLPDGSKVWLNSGSKLSFSNLYGQKTRDIKLSGEAFFVVAKNKAVPFSVFANGLKVTALGTSFNVKAYNEENTVETTLEEGKLKIGLSENTNNQNITLYPGHTLSYTKSENGQPCFKVDSVKDMNLYTSWRGKRWIFRHETLEGLARKLERRYDVTIIFKDSKLKEYRISGSLQDEPVEQVLHVLQLIAPIRYKIEHSTIQISTDNLLKKKLESMRLSPDGSAQPDCY
jgi:ferric-dicitrate binding protein FerR (iron transport regulator)